MLIKRHDDFGSRLRGYRELPGEQLLLENYNVLKNIVHSYRPYHRHEWMTSDDGFIAEADSRKHT